MKGSIRMLTLEANKEFTDTLTSTTDKTAQPVSKSLKDIYSSFASVSVSELEQRTEMKRFFTELFSTLSFSLIRKR